MQAALLAAVQPDNTPHGYNLTFAFPMLMFIIIAGALYLRFRRPHRVPGHVDLASASSQASASAMAATTAEPAAGTTAPDPSAALTAEPDVPASPPESAAESAEGTA